MAHRTIPEESVSHEFIIGRKDICSFFDVQCWGTIRRWKRKYGLPLRYLPNSKPMYEERGDRLLEDGQQVKRNPYFVIEVALIWE